MTHLTAAALSLSMAAATAAHGQESAGDSAIEAIGAVSTALEVYKTETLYGDVWQSPDLSARDRSIVTVASLIARNQAADMPAEFSVRWRTTSRRPSCRKSSRISPSMPAGATRCPPSRWRRMSSPRTG